MQKKLLSILLVLCMLLSMFPVALPVSAEETTENTETATVTEIADAAALAALMADSSQWGGSFKLTADINLTGATQSPIGTSAVPFTGTFDGDGHKITNLSLTGYTTTSVGLFGYVNGGATIKNLTVSGTVSTSNSRSGGIVGQVVGSATVQNCTADITVTADAGGAGGIVGTFSIATAGDTLTIQNCTNKGSVTGKQYNAGILGFVTGSKTGTSLTITGCKNYGAISTTTGNVCAGIAGYIAGSATSGTNTIEITDCGNYGAIDCNGGTGYVGGIVGAIGGGNLKYAFTVVIDNCYNEGTVEGVSNVGGIAGLLRPAVTTGGAAYTITDVMTADKGGLPVLGAPGSGSSTTSITITVTRGYTVNGDAIVGANTATYATVTEDNCYTSASSSSALATLAATDGWVMGSDHPELATFHVHTEKYLSAGKDGHRLACPCGDESTFGEVESHTIVDGFCTVCGYADCAHENTSDSVTKAATCSETGLKNVVCDDCGTVISENETVELDDGNHADATVSIAYDADNGCITYTCDNCGTVLYEDWTVGTDIYVATTGTAINGSTAFDSDIGLDAETAFADLETAIEYAAASATANGDVTVHIVDKGTISTANYATPEYDDATITITGGELHFAAAATRFFQNGDVTVEKTTINNEAGLVWPAQGNKIVMGEGITHGSTNSIYLLGGWQGSKDSVGGEVNGDVTVRSGDWYLVTAGNRQGSRTHYGASKMTLGTVNDTDTLTIGSLPLFHTNGGDLSADSTLTLTIDGKVSITTLYPGIHTTSSAVGTAYTYTVDVVLKEGADITTDNVFNNIAPQSTIIWNVYADQDNEAAVADAARFVSTDNITVNQYTYKQYCLNVLGGHFGDGDVCTECGAAISGCTHDNTTQQTVTAATCTTKGSAEIVCDECGQTVSTVELDIEAKNHVEEQEYVWTVNAETGAYEILCTGCDAVLHTQTELPTVYVGNNSSVGDDTADGLTADTKVASLTEAVERIKNVGGTVRINGGVKLDSNIVLPDWNGTITFTSDTYDSYGAATTGFTVTKQGAQLTLGGDAKFDALLFKGTSTSTYRAIISANWHNVDFGYIRVQQYATVYLLAGVYGVTESDTETKTTKITVDGPALSTNAKSYFYERIYLGSAFTSDNIEVSNKTVTLEVNDGYINTQATERTRVALIHTVYTMSTTNARPAALTKNCSSTVTLYGSSGINTFRTGDRNVGYDEVTDEEGNVTTVASQAWLDNLVVNFENNSQIPDIAADATTGVTARTGTFQIKNAKNVTIHVSDEADGRTVPLTHSLFLYKYGTFVDTEAKVTATYGTHSFDASITDPIKETGRSDGLYPYTVTENVTDECTWDDGKITTEATPDAAGVKTYTCSGCGRTKTEEVEFVCTEHAYVVKADGTYYCTNKCEDVEAPSADVIISASPAT
ncbi:MAG: hypothetical protein IJ002_05225, partial [Clostridia bacterium]|nr:hypothetical protein [Clostridia bacterium]